MKKSSQDTVHTVLTGLNNKHLKLMALRASDCQDLHVLASKSTGPVKRWVKAIQIPKRFPTPTTKVCECRGRSLSTSTTKSVIAMTKVCKHQQPKFVIATAKVYKHRQPKFVNSAAEVCQHRQPKFVRSRHGKNLKTLTTNVCEYHSKSFTCGRSNLTYFWPVLHIEVLTQENW